MAFDYSKLRGRIIEKFDTQAKFAVAIGWSERTLSLKINGNRSWKQTDICKAMVLLDLEEGNIAEYFFTPKVQKIEPLKREGA